MDEYSFKKFTAINSRQENRITVTRSRSFGFPTKFYQDNKIDNFKYVILFYDNTKKAVAIVFTNDESETSKFSILKSKDRKYGGSVIATSFFKVNDIDPGEYYGRYHWKNINLPEAGNAFVIELKKRGQANGDES